MIKTTEDLKYSGEITEQDWKLFICNQETGRESLLAWGPGDQIVGHMQLMARQGADVWIIDPTGVKVTLKYDDVYKPENRPLRRPNLVNAFLQGRALTGKMKEAVAAYIGELEKKITQWGM